VTPEMSENKQKIKIKFKNNYHNLGAKTQATKKFVRAGELRFFQYF
jgi:hypothetical protein